MPKLTFTPEQLESNFKTVDEGIWILELTGFAPKVSKNKDSLNYNPIFEIVSDAQGNPAPTQDDGKAIRLKYAFTGNSKIPNFLQDMCHCFGLPMEGDDVNGYGLPGIFDGSQHESADMATWHPEKWEYKGPLLRRKGQVYLVKSDYNGTTSNKIKYFVCAISDCTQRWPKIKHNTDMLKGSN